MKAGNGFDSVLDVVLCIETIAYSYPTTHSSLKRVPFALPCVSRRVRIRLAALGL